MARTIPSLEHVSARSPRERRPATTDDAVSRRTFVTALGLLIPAASSLAASPATASSSSATPRAHQPGQDVFRSIRPEDLDWKPFPAFPPSARLAVVVGRPSEPGPYLVRVKLPHDVKLMPHKHPEDRVYTVISGVFYIGLGDAFDAEKLNAYPPGTVLVLPGDTAHFHWAKSGEYVTQVTGIGPLGIEYVDPKDDPRNGH